MESATIPTRPADILSHDDDFDDMEELEEEEEEDEDSVSFWKPGYTRIHEGESFVMVKFPGVYALDSAEFPEPYRG